MLEPNTPWSIIVETDGIWPLADGGKRIGYCVVDCDGDPVASFESCTTDEDGSDDLELWATIVETMNGAWAPPETAAGDPVPRPLHTFGMGALIPIAKD